ncbi:MAG: ABC transporter permease [Roseiarcus sp.]
MSIEAAVEGRRPSRLAYFLGQNVGLVLALTMLAVAIVVYCAVYWWGQGGLPGNFEITSTVNNTMPLVLTAMGQAFVVIARGLDLSVGGVMDLSNALAAVYIRDNAASMIGWSVLILAIGAALGLANGLLVGVGRLQPILVTLATLSIYQGLAIRVLPQPGGSIPPAYTAALVNPNQPYALLEVLIVALLWYAFRRSAIGVSIVAIGNDELAARANGVDAVRARVTAFALSGLMSGAAGLFLAATATAGDATTGNGYTLSSIVAVVLGGMNLFGGRGSGVGVVAGAFVTTMIVNILFFSNIDPLYQSFYEGLFLVVAVVLGALIGRLLGRRR